MALPQKAYQLATLYSISGAATGVYLMTSVAGKYVGAVDLVSLILAFLIAVSLYLLRPEKAPWWNPVHLLLIAINGSLIFIHAIGYNAAANAFPTQQASKVTKGSLFPSFDPTPWFPPADQRIAAQNMVLTAKAVLASSDQVLTSLGDLSASIRSERSEVERRLRDERPEVERRLKEDRLRMEGRLRDERSALEERLRARGIERQRLEETLRKGVHPAERPSIERALLEVEQAEQRARAELVNYEGRAQQVLRDLAAEEQRKLAELSAKESQLTSQLRDVAAKEKRLKELEKDAAPVVQTLKQEIHMQQERLSHSVRTLEQSYAGAETYFFRARSADQ